MKYLFSQKFCLYLFKKCSMHLTISMNFKTLCKLFLLVRCVYVKLSSDIDLVATVLSAVRMLIRHS